MNFPTINQDMLNQLRGLFFAKDRSLLIAKNQVLGMGTQNTPSTPQSPYIFVYPKADGKFYKLDSEGNEELIGGLGKAIQDKKFLELAKKDLTMITGQLPAVCKATKSVSNFKLREDMEIGLKVTVRGIRMYEFMDRLISLAIPRVRDFRGLNQNSFDGRGNYSMGLSEQSVFPEINVAKIEFQQGMNITFVTTAKTDDEARTMLELFGMPFRKN